jgi:hypothetical protein
VSKTASPSVSSSILSSLETASLIISSGILSSRQHSSLVQKDLLISKSITRTALDIFFAAVGLTMCYRVIFNDVLVLTLSTAIVNKPRAVL